MVYIVKGIWETKRVFINNKELSPEPSQAVINHSPDGFNWGYHGSGPAQLAAALALEILGDIEGYQNILTYIISRLPQKNFKITLTYKKIKSLCKGEDNENIDRGGNSSGHHNL